MVFENEIMKNVTPPILLTAFTSSFLTWKNNTKENKIFLTFDDGPNAGVTENILDILEKYDVKATFFCVGAEVVKNRALFTKIKKSGHATGNHSYSHFNGWKTGVKEYIQDIEKADRIIESGLFRPPYGKITLKQAFMLKRQFRIVMWSVLSGDFDVNISKEKCFDNVRRLTQRGSIVVFHDSEKAAERCLYALPRFIEHFLEKDFEFELLSTL